jgi:hypothetical protein
MFLELQVDPFAPALGFHDEDLWRLDRWVFIKRDQSITPDLPVPIEWEMHPRCSTTFQTACLKGDMGTIDELLTVKRKVISLAANENKRSTVMLCLRSFYQLGQFSAGR